MNFEKDDRKSLHCIERTVSRNMDVDDCAVEDSEESEKYGKENIYPFREYLIVMN